MSPRVRSLPGAASLLMMALLATPVPARAAPPGDDAAAAQRLLDAGLRSYAVGQYGDAVRAFREGYRLDPRPDFLYALGQAHRMSGDYEAAIAAYRAFLRTDPPERSAAGARQNLERCQAQLAAARAVAPPPPPPPLTVSAPHRPWHRDPAGAVLGALGLAACGAGGALWGVGEAGVESANAATRYDQFLAGQTADRERAAGIVSVAVGGALLIAAVARYAWVARHR
jgi:tetratricopeptide (TPR) repeat protein